MGTNNTYSLSFSVGHSNYPHVGEVVSEFECIPKFEIANEILSLSRSSLPHPIFGESRLIYLIQCRRSVFAAVVAWTSIFFRSVHSTSLVFIFRF